MTGKEALAALAVVADELESLAGTIGFEDSASYEVEDAWNVVQEAVYSLDQTLQALLEQSFLRAVDLNPAPKLHDVKTFPV